MNSVLMVIVSIMILIGAHTVETTTVVETYDGTMLVKMYDGNIHKYTFENIIKEEMHAIIVVLVDG